MNPFRRYRANARAEAVARGVIRDVCSVTGFVGSTVSRTFSGDFKWPNEDVVAAINEWLKRHDLPEAETHVRTTVRVRVNELRRKKVATEE